MANPNELLQEVIASIRWPEGTRAKIGELRAQLEGAETDDAWVEVMRRISDLAAQALARAHQDAEASSVFLAQLTERLEAIDHYMLGDSERRQASRASGVALGEAVSNELGGLSASMQGEQELPAQREQVLGVLDRIQHHVTDHLAHESQRSSSAEQEAERLQQQLHELEEETFKLRRQVEESRQLAMRDALTGLPNRRALEARAAEELARRRRFGKPLALVVFDVDDFKQINDVFGHKAGDRALALIARVLTESLRETDFIARYGGEELVALLPGADRDAALTETRQTNPPRRLEFAMDSSRLRAHAGPGVAPFRVRCFPQLAQQTVTGRGLAREHVAQFDEITPRGRLLAPVRLPGRE